MHADTRSKLDAAAYQRISAQHAHRAPDAAALEVIRQVRQATFDLHALLETLLPASRERSCAITHLDDVRMWACNAACLGGEVREPLKLAPDRLDQIRDAAKAVSDATRPDDIEGRVNVAADVLQPLLLLASQG